MDRAVAWPAPDGEPASGGQGPRPWLSVRSAAPARSGEGGVTLIELLIAVTIMAVGVLAILEGWRFAIESSSRHRSQAATQTVLASAVEQVLAPSFKLPKCASPAAMVATYQTEARKAVLPTSGGWTPDRIRVTAVQYWNGALGTLAPGSSPTAVPPAVWGPTCDDRLPLHRVTVEVRSPDGKVTQRLEVVKRRD